jgi:DNA-binding IclR family transcriptional regulator
MENKFDGIKSFIVPVLDKNQKIMSALTLTMPLARIKSDAIFINALQATATPLPDTDRRRPRRLILYEIII